MKTLAFFSIDDNYLSFCLAQASPRRHVMAMDTVAISALSDEQITQRLKDLIKQHRVRLHETKAVAVVPRANVMLRHMSLPSHKDDELRAMIDLQIVNHIPYAREEVEIDFQVVEQKPDGYSDVLVVIVTHEAAMRHWKIFTGAGLDVVQMSISSVGLWMLYRQQPDRAAGATAVIDMRASQTEICLCANSCWYNSRSIPVGLDAIKANGWDEFKKQWQGTLALADKDKRLRVSHAFLATGSNAPQDVAGNLANALDIKVKGIKLRNAPAATLTAVLGMALSTEAIDINLVPQEVRAAQLGLRRQREKATCLAWGIGGVLVLVAALNMGQVQKNRRLDFIQGQIKEAQEQASRVQAKWQLIQDIQGQLNNRIIIARVIEILQQAVTPGMVLVNLNLTDGSVLSFQGIAAMPNDIAQLQNRLMNQALFASVNLDYVNKRVTQDGEVNYFKLTAHMKQQKADDEAFK